MSLIVWRSSSVKRPLCRRRHPSEGGVEAETGLDADRQLVDGVGGLGLHVRLTLVTHAEHPVIGQEEQQHGGDQREDRMPGEGEA